MTPSIKITFERHVYSGFKNKTKRVLQAQLSSILFKKDPARWELPPAPASHGGPGSPAI